MKHPLHASNSTRITAAGSRGRCASGCGNEGGTQTSADQLLGEVPILHGLLKLTITSDVRGFFFTRHVPSTSLSYRADNFAPCIFIGRFMLPLFSLSFLSPFYPSLFHGMASWNAKLDSIFNSVSLLIEEILVEFNEFVIVTYIRVFSKEQQLDRTSGVCLADRMMVRNVFNNKYIISTTNNTDSTHL